MEATPTSFAFSDMSVQTGREKGLEESEIFHILGNDRRRAIVQQLAVGADQLEVSKVATEIAAEEAEGTPVPNNLYKSVYVSLQQTHLPQLQEDGVITYDTDSKAITAGPQFEDVMSYINGEGSNYTSLFAGYVVLSVSGLAAIALAGLELPLPLDPLLVSVLILLVIAGSSLYQLLG